MQETGWHSGTGLGALVRDGGVEFSVASATAGGISVSLFDDRGMVETARHELARGEGGVWSAFVPGIGEGTRYGLRADGEYDPARGFFFDPEKLLADPYCLAIDRRYAYHARLAAPRGKGGDTAALMPKGVVVATRRRLFPAPPLFRPGGLVYEINVRGFTMRHPAIEAAERGTIAALRHPAIIEHLVKMKVGAVELMPVVAWIDEARLPPLGLSDAWGYNPVTFMALDPRLAPGGVAELRDTAATLRGAGMGVILDVVLGHTGEGGAAGPILALRGLDNLTYYRHAGEDAARLVDDTGCGNTLAADRPVVRRMILDALRHFVLHADIDGFRFHHAPVPGRKENGLDANAALFGAIAADPVLADRVLIAEPWDASEGEGGARLGNFPTPFLEWNPRYRDDVRRFWRGDRGMAAGLATRISGSFDIAGEDTPATRGVSFIATHDGMTLADLVSFRHRHNAADGGDGRDRRQDNYAWNGGIEGVTADQSVLAGRRRDCLALLSTLFASRGTIMLTAGDEFGRTQNGNDHAYAQDNATTWLDWDFADVELREHAYALAALRARLAVLGDPRRLAREEEDGVPGITWLAEEGHPLADADWQDASRKAFAMLVRRNRDEQISGVVVFFNGHSHPRAFRLPGRSGFAWRRIAGPGHRPSAETAVAGMISAPARSVLFFEEYANPDGSKPE